MNLLLHLVGVGANRRGNSGNMQGVLSRVLARP